MKGQVLVITGGASGIGAELVRGALQRGARVVALDRDVAGLRALSASVGDSSGRLRTSALDVRDAAQWQTQLDETIGHWSRLDVLMNVAGVLRPGYVQDIEAADVDLHFDVNLKGLVHGTRLAARIMAAQKAGHIINIASIAGLAPVPGLSLYSASKFAVRSFSLAAAYELRPLGVKLTVVCPDAVATPMLDLQRDREEAALTFSGKARALTATDVAEAIFRAALPRAPLELLLPASRGRMAKLGAAFPELNYAALELMRRRGRKRQSAAYPHR